MGVICDYCGNTFSNKGNLSYHQRNAKYCKNIQKEFNEIQSKKSHKCEACDKIYAYKSSLKNHEKKCTVAREKVVQKKLKDEHDETQRKLDKKLKYIKDLQEEVDWFQKTLEDCKKENAELREQLARKEGQVEGIKMAPPRTTNTNTTHTKTYNNHPKIMNINHENIRPYDDSTLIEEIENGRFTRQMFANGRRGIEEFIMGIVKLELEDGQKEQSSICSDRSRNSFYRLAESRDWVMDNECKYLETVFHHLQPLATEYFDELKEISRSETDPVKRKHYERQVKELRPIFLGISYGGEDREKLLSELRSVMKKEVSV